MFAPFVAMPIVYVCVQMCARFLARVCFPGLASFRFVTCAHAFHVKWGQAFVLLASRLREEVGQGDGWVSHVVLCDTTPEIRVFENCCNSLSQGLKVYSACVSLAESTHV